MTENPVAQPQPVDEKAIEISSRLAGLAGVIADKATVITNQLLREPYNSPDIDSHRLIPIIEKFNRVQSSLNDMLHAFGAEKERDFTKTDTFTEEVKFKDNEASQGFLYQVLSQYLDDDPIELQTKIKNSKATIHIVAGAAIVITVDTSDQLTAKSTAELLQLHATNGVGESKKAEPEEIFNQIGGFTFDAKDGQVPVIMLFGDNNSETLDHEINEVISNLVNSSVLEKMQIKREAQNPATTIPFAELIADTASRPYKLLDSEQSLTGFDIQAINNPQLESAEIIEQITAIVTVAEIRKAIKTKLVQGEDPQRLAAFLRTQIADHVNVLELLNPGQGKAFKQKLVKLENELESKNQDVLHAQLIQIATDDKVLTDRGDTHIASRVEGRFITAEATIREKEVIECANNNYAIIALNKKGGAQSATATVVPVGEKEVEIHGLERHEFYPIKDDAGKIQLFGACNIFQGDKLIRTTYYQKQNQANIETQQLPSLPDTIPRYFLKEILAPDIKGTGEASKGGHQLVDQEIKYWKRYPLAERDLSIVSQIVDQQSRHNILDSFIQTDTNTLSKLSTNIVQDFDKLLTNPPEQFRQSARQLKKTLEEMQLLLQARPNAHILGSTYEYAATLYIGGLSAAYKKCMGSLSQLTNGEIKKELERIGERAQREYGASLHFGSQSEHIALAIDAKLIGERKFIVMEYKGKMDAEEWNTVYGSLNEEQAIVILEDIGSVLTGLEKSPEGARVHRDIKPANIRLDTDASGKIQRAHLSDLGLLARKGMQTEVGAALPTFAPYIADGQTVIGVATGATDKQALTNRTHAAGTNRYMPLEQAQGKPLDPRMDQYAFGSAIIEMIVGDTPNSLGLLVLANESQRKAMLSAELTSKGISPQLQEILIKMTSFNPDNRFRTSSDLVDELSIFTNPFDRLDMRSGYDVARLHQSKTLDDVVNFCREGLFPPSDIRTNTIKFIAKTSVNSLKAIVLTNTLAGANADIAQMIKDLQAASRRRELIRVSYDTTYKRTVENADNQRQLHLATPDQTSTELMAAGISWSAHILDQLQHIYPDQPAQVLKLFQELVNDSFEAHQVADIVAIMTPDEYLMHPNTTKDQKRELMQAISATGQLVITSNELQELINQQSRLLYNSDPGKALETRYVAIEEAANRVHQAAAAMTATSLMNLLLLNSSVAGNAEAWSLLWALGNDAVSNDIMKVIKSNIDGFKSEPNQSARQKLLGRTALNIIDIVAYHKSIKHNERQQDFLRQLKEATARHERIRVDKTIPLEANPWISEWKLIAARWQEEFEALKSFHLDNVGIRGYDQLKKDIEKYVFNGYTEIGQALYLNGSILPPIQSEPKPIIEGLFKKETDPSKQQRADWREYMEMQNKQKAELDQGLSDVIKIMDEAL